MSQPSDKPMSNPPSETSTNSNSPSARLNSPVKAAPKMMLKITTAEPSLKRLSPSIIVVSFLGAPNARNIATTATGSVAAMSAPKISAVESVNDVPQATRPPTTNVLMMTPKMASIKIGDKFWRSSLTSTWKAASKSKGGRKSAKISSSVNSIVIIP